MVSPYRDSLEALRQRIHALDAEIDSLERGYTETFWDCMAPTLDLSLPEKGNSPDKEATFEQLMAASSGREARIVELQRVERDWALIEERWRRPANDAPPLELVDANWATRVDRVLKIKGRGLAEFESVLEEHTPGVPIVGLEPDGLGCILEMEGVLHAVTYQSWSDSRSAEQEPLNKVSLRVAPGTSDVRLLPQNFGDELLSLLRMKQDIQLGHHDFDGFFLVQGDEDAANALLTDEVRVKLLSLARDDIPRLEVSQGVASLYWFWTLKRSSLETAMETLRILREVPPTRALRRTEVVG